MGMIPKHKIDEIYDATRIEEVVGDYVSLKKRGANLLGLCPFHGEKTPSFTVSPTKGIYKCFGCSAGGNAVSFVMDLEQISYPEALKQLAKKYSIEIEEQELNPEQKAALNKRESLYLLNEFAQTYFEDQYKSQLGELVAQAYTRDRKIANESVEKFHIGFLPDVKDGFAKYAIKQGYSKALLQETGLSIFKDSNVYDRFRDRIIFPIHSLSGRVLGFGGRILKTDKKLAKYVNSPESDVYHKSKVLYGIFQAKRAIAKQDSCILVEGYTDVISFHQSGIEHVVSSSGTALTKEQVRLIKRFTNNLTVIFDGDSAGIKAALRGIDIILENGLNVQVLALPEGEDPDSFAKKTPHEDLVLYLEENSKDFIAFKAGVLNEEAKNDPIKKAETIREIITSISKIPDTIKRELYIKECARIMDISEQVLFSTLAQLSNKARQGDKKGGKQQQQSFDVVHKSKQPVKKVDEQYELERKIIQILLLYATVETEFEEYYLKENDTGELELDKELEVKSVHQKVFLSLQEDEVEFANELFQVLYYKIVEKLQSDSKLQIDTFVNVLEPVLASEVTSILMNEERYSLNDWERQNIFPIKKEDNIGRLVNENILSLRRFLVTKKIDELAKSVSQEISNIEIIQEIMDYTALKKVLSEKLNRVL